MKLNAVGVTSKDMKRTIEFYKLLGFNFDGLNLEEKHIEPVLKEGNLRLMIDQIDIVKDIIGEEPVPSNHSHFAIEYDTPGDISDIVDTLKKNGFKVFKEPWEAFWNQFYAIVEDPEGYRIDLYCDL